MIKSGIILVLVSLLVLVGLPACGSAAARQNGIGMEYVSGEPIGISLKASTGAHSAVVLGGTWLFDDEEKVNVHLDWLVYASRYRYYGVGLSARYTDNEDIDDIVLRFPLGFEKTISADLPIAFFGELVPGLELSPASEFNLSFTVGLRYLFVL